ncbi:hypothetical protein GIB67_016928 [Kingdonia uniflora]|uniref:Ribosomal protein S6 n=1 Tax=Kingdonia uniflora TaxID=39325 RepID=A0A7J7M3I0_9MAGN|nr:hypothetical protein GIB67_016928 [Kingdonia uniflora]
MPLYDCMLLLKPHIKKEQLIELVTKVGRRATEKNGVLTDIKSFGTVQLGYGIKKLDGKYFQCFIPCIEVCILPKIIIKQLKLIQRHFPLPLLNFLYFSCAESPDCMLLKPLIKKEQLMELVTRVGRRATENKGVLTDIKLFGTVQLGYGIKKLDGKYFQVFSTHNDRIFMYGSGSRDSCVKYLCISVFGGVCEAVCSLFFSR